MVKNGQTRSNNSSAFANELFECVWPFCRIDTYRINLQLSTLLKKRLWHRFFFMNFVNFFKNIFLWNTSWKLLLKEEFYENWRADIFIIKRYCEIYNSFKEQMLQGKGSLWEPFHNRQYCTYKEFFVYARKKKAKSLKYSSKRFYF